MLFNSVVQFIYIIITFLSIYSVNYPEGNFDISNINVDLSFSPFSSINLLCVNFQLSYKVLPLSLWNVSLCPLISFILKSNSYKHFCSLVISRLVFPFYICFHLFILKEYLPLELKCISYNCKYLGLYIYGQFVLPASFKSRNVGFKPTVLFFYFWLQLSLLLFLLFCFFCECF